MSWFSRLWARILLVAFLNVGLLLAAFFLLARSQLRLDLSSFLLTPAKYRILSISRLAAIEFANEPREKWNDLLQRYESLYPSEFFLFDREGTQISGKPVIPPAALFEPHHLSNRGFRSGPFKRALNSSGAPFSAADPPPNPGPPPEPSRFRDAQFGVVLHHTEKPSTYWASVHVPIFETRGEPPLDARLVWRFRSLWTNSFFVDYRPIVVTILLIIGISIACWLPLIHSVTKAVAAMTKATGQIALGHFEIQLPIKRRDELGRLSESINKMASRLSGFVTGQRRFLGDIAHELCSPIARIQLSLGILEQRADETAKGYVQTVNDEVQHMSTLVGELLSFSKASVGAAAALESVSVLEMVNRAVEREKTSEVIINVDVPSALSVLAQRDYLFRSIANVLRNAIRYAGSAGPIEISAKAADDFAVINISDHGPGVSAEELEEILKPFYRPETARQRETGGVGLGLAIVKTCIEACRGSVACRNRVPKGFEVDLRLPCAG